jgi:hypothetical protein
MQVESSGLIVVPEASLNVLSPLVLPCLKLGSDLASDYAEHLKRTYFAPLAGGR